MNELLSRVQAEQADNGIYHHFGAGGNDWDVINGLVYNYRGAVIPAEVLAAYPLASALKVAQIQDPNGPGNGEGGSDFANIALGIAFIGGGAALSSFFGAPAASSIVGSASPGALTVSQAAMADIALGGAGGSEGAAALTTAFAPAAGATLTLPGVPGLVSSIKTAGQVATAGATLARAFGDTAGTAAIAPATVAPVAPAITNPVQPASVGSSAFTATSSSPLVTTSSSAPATFASAATDAIASMSTTQMIVAGAALAAVLAFVFYRRG